MRSLLLLTLAALTGASAPAAPYDLAANGDFAAGLQGWSLPQDGRCVASVVEAQAGPYRRALRLVLRPEAGQPSWSINLSQPLADAVAQGHRLQLALWLRSPDGCRVMPYVEEAEAPFAKSLSQVLTLTPEWREHTLNGTALADYGPDRARLGFHLGFDPGTVELAGVRLLDLEVPTMDGPRPMLEQPLSLLTNGDFAAGLDGWVANGGARLQASLVEAEVNGRTQRAVRLAADPPADGQPWSLGFGRPIAQPVRRGDAVWFRAWLRSPERVRVTFIFELASPPNSKDISQQVTLTPEWREYRFAGRAPRSYQPGEATAKWFLGHGPGTVEIADVRVDNCGPAAGHVFDQTIDWWGGRDHPDTWRAPALERIERLRQGDVTVHVVDAAGRPVPGARVTVTQQRHAFRFGTAAPAARLVDTENPDNLRFQQEVQRLYNTVTFENDLKWPAWDERRQAVVDQAIEWLRARDIEARGHCLAWGSYQHIPAPVNALRGDALRAAIGDHVRAYGERFRGRVYLWDVVNEAATNTEVWDEVGWEQFAEAFRTARAADPDAKLCYNDYGIVNENPGHRKKVAERIRYLLDHGAPVDTLGIQAHMSTPLTPIHRVLEILDEWAAFGKELEITEFDLGCPDDAVHAQYLRDFMIAAFSHPKVTAFIQWGFWAGSHWRAKDQGAMFRLDWSPRPAQAAYEDLVLNQWWTRWQGAAANGTATLRAFHGRHEVTAEAGGRRAVATLELLPGEAGEVTVRMPF